MPDESADASVEATLRRIIITIDPVPSAVLDAAREALSWRDPDAALAALVEDSALAGAGTVRSTGGARLLTFTLGELTIEIEARRSTERLDLYGQLVPPGPATITVDSRSGSQSVQADALGRFAVAAVPAGPVRLRCRTAEENNAVTVQTEWVLL